MFSSKDAKEKKSTPIVNIEFKISEPMSPLEIVIQNQGHFLLSEAVNFIITRRMELRFQPRFSSIKRNIFLKYVYQGDFEKAHTMLKSYPHTIAGVEKLKVLLTIPGEIRNFLGRTLCQTPLQTALRCGDASMAAMIKFYLRIQDKKGLSLIPNCEEIIEREEIEYIQYLTKQQNKIVCNEEKIPSNKHERDLEAFSKALRAIKEAESLYDPQLDIELNAFRKYLYEADQRDEPFNEKLLIQAFRDFGSYIPSLDIPQNFRTQKFFRELIGAIEAIAPPICQKAFAQQEGVQWLVKEKTARLINRKLKIQFCPWNANGVLDQAFPGIAGLRLGVDSACDHAGATRDSGSTICWDFYELFFRLQIKLTSTHWDLITRRPQEQPVHSSCCSIM